MSDSLNRESEKAKSTSHRRFYETNPPWRPERGATDENADEKITKRTHSVIFGSVVFYTRLRRNGWESHGNSSLQFLPNEPIARCARRRKGERVIGRKGAMRPGAMGDFTKRTQSLRCAVQGSRFKGSEFAKRIRRPPSYGVPASAG
jgi:hypothetical protein